MHKFFSVFDRHPEVAVLLTVVALGLVIIGGVIYEAGDYSKTLLAGRLFLGGLGLLCVVALGFTDNSRF